MRPSSVLSLAASLFKKSKFRVIFIGIEFAYLLYKVIQRQRLKQKKALPVPDDTTA